MTDLTEIISGNFQQVACVRCLLSAGYTLVSGTSSRRTGYQTEIKCSTP
jgi:hypothetical protein